MGLLTGFSLISGIEILYFAAKIGVGILLGRNGRSIRGDKSKAPK